MNIVKKVVRKIFVLRERMQGEGRVALTPLDCLDLTKLGYKVYVERSAGEKSGFEDYHYRQLGANVVSVSEIIPLLQSPNTMVLKVKQPLPEDDVWLSHMKNGVLFAYFHSTGEKDRWTLDILLKNNITAISYELIQADDGVYPVLVPMSKIAGLLAVEWGLKLSRETRERVGKKQTENRYLCMTVFGGAGTVGLAAVEKGLKLGFSCITVFEKDEAKRGILYGHFPPKKTTRTQLKFFSPESPGYEDVLAHELANTDLLIGAVLVPGGHSPIVVSEERVKLMQSGSVIVDVAVDQGGCIWHPENETASTFEFEGKTFVRVPNMPGSVPKESTPILAEALFPYLLQVLGNGTVDVKKALQKGVITGNGKVMNKEVAAYYGEKYASPDEFFGI